MIIIFFSTKIQAATFTYDDTTAAAINTNVSCTAPTGGAGAAIANINRTFNVSTNFIVSDLNVGFNATHTWRGDVQLTLTSPTGTAVILLVPDTSGTGGEDNWNLYLDDEATGAADNNANDNTALAYNNRSGQPNNLLSAFDGENAFGTWTISICDKYPTQDNGTYNSSQLLFESEPIADLVINKLSSSATYTPGLVLSYTLNVTNNGPDNASGITVTDNLPNGLTLNSPVSCSAIGTASCGAASFGTAGDSGFTDTAASVNAGVGNSLTYIIEVLPSSVMTDYNP